MHGRQGTDWIGRELDGTGRPDGRSTGNRIGSAKRDGLHSTPCAPAGLLSFFSVVLAQSPDDEVFIDYKACGVYWALQGGVIIPFCCICSVEEGMEVVVYLSTCGVAIPDGRKLGGDWPLARFEMMVGGSRISIVVVVVAVVGFVHI